MLKKDDEYLQLLCCVTRTVSRHSMELFPYFIFHETAGKFILVTSSLTLPYSTNAKKALQFDYM
jgi:hypothetical protein